MVKKASFKSGVVVVARHSGVFAVVARHDSGVVVVVARKDSRVVEGRGPYDLTVN